MRQYNEFHFTAHLSLVVSRRLCWPFFSPGGISRGVGIPLKWTANESSDGNDEWQRIRLNMCHFEFLEGSEILFDINICIYSWPLSTVNLEQKCWINDLRNTGFDPSIHFLSFLSFYWDTVIAQVCTPFWNWQLDCVQNQIATKTKGFVVTLTAIWNCL